jgi:hypothetical protein
MGTTTTCDGGPLLRMGTYYRGWGTTNEDQALLTRREPQDWDLLGRMGNHEPRQGTTDEDLEDGYG